MFLATSKPSPSKPSTEARLAPVDARQAPLFCFALLVTASALASLVLACATPFAAFAIIAAAALPLQSALLVVAGAWLVNQGIGFGLLHYPIDATTIAWGFVIGAAALAATLIAAFVLQALRTTRALLALPAALVAAYAAYELTLLAATPVLGGTAAITADIVARLGLTSIGWLIGLAAICEIVRLSIAMHRNRQRT
jgi:hypothetical protein